MTDVMTCSFETLLALEDQMPRDTFERIKIERPDFAAWLNARRAPAFPTGLDTGLTMRDCFAMAALNIVNGMALRPSGFAKGAYAIADAMLKERSRRPSVDDDEATAPETRAV